MIHEYLNEHDESADIVHLANARDMWCVAGHIFIVLYLFAWNKQTNIQASRQTDKQTNFLLFPVNKLLILQFYLAMSYGLIMSTYATPVILQCSVGILVP